MTKWTKEYDNDTGPYDDYFEEWWNVTDGNHIYRCKNSDDADFLISALAQPEQKPVAWLHPANATCVTTDPTAYARGIPLYTAPSQSEPVAFNPPQKWRDSEIADGYRGIRWVTADGVYGTPTQDDVVKYLGYTTPPQRKPLTDEEIERLDCIYALWDDGESCTIMGIKDFARAIEAAHDIKE